jgi:esterase
VPESAQKLSFRRFGAQGQKLILLHGLLGSGRNWYTLAQRFAEEFQVYVPDLRGHGESPKVPPLDYPHLAADVAALLEEEGIKTASFIGHSMGGKVAMVLALTRPETVAKLVVVDIAPVRYAQSFDSLIAALKALPLEAIKNRHEAEAWLHAKLGNPRLGRFLLQNLAADGGRYYWRIDLDLIASALPAIIDFPALPEARPFGGPTLFVGGGLSDYLKQEFSYMIKALFPNAKIEVLPHAGHWVHIDQPAEFTSKVRSFLRSLGD